MTLDEALRIKSSEGEEFLSTDPSFLDEADRLSLEAIKLVQRERLLRINPVETLLPGETL